MSETEFSIFWNAYSWTTILTLLPTLRGKKSNCVLGLQTFPFGMLVIYGDLELQNFFISNVISVGIITSNVCF
jgi:hypothetical protein